MYIEKDRHSQMVDESGRAVDPKRPTPSVLHARGGGDEFRPHGKIDLENSLHYVLPLVTFAMLTHTSTMGRRFKGMSAFLLRKLKFE